MSAPSAAFEEWWKTQPVAWNGYKGLVEQAFDAGYRAAPPGPSPHCRHCGKPLTYVVTYRHEDDPPFYFSAQSPGPPGGQTLTMTITTPTHEPEP